jgi:hypothetical protein
MRHYLERQGALTSLPAAWSSKDVGAWLAAQKLEAYAGAFEANGICGADLLDLTHADLQSMNIERCTDRKAILRSVGFSFSLCVHVCVCVCVYAREEGGLIWVGRSCGSCRRM